MSATTNSSTIDKQKLPEQRNEAAPEILPNIVLIVADDLGCPYAGFMGDPNT
jgi:hypothetical protein